MFALIRRKSHVAKADPAPSRWAWRMQRLMLTPGFRFGLKLGIPFCLVLLSATIYLSDAARRAAISASIVEARRSIEARPEFMVKLMAIDGADGPLSAIIRDTIPLNFPLSSFDLDLSALRSQVAALDGVKSVGVRIRPGGILQLDVIPRRPVTIWRSASGLTLLDEGGAHVADVETRAEHPELPLIAGEGASRHVPEALELLRVGSALGPRLYGLVRIGERRWDVVLDRDQRIMLPEKGARQALERVIALDGAEEVLARDVARVDMRLADRPTVRMNKEATREWWHIRQFSGQ